MRVRIELRSRWREWLAVALFAGLAGGLVIAAAAGARRTDSALTRHLVAYRFPDAQVVGGNDSADNSDSYFKKTIAHVRTLPQVTASAETAELGYCARDRYNRPVEVTGPINDKVLVTVNGRLRRVARRPKPSAEGSRTRRAREVSSTAARRSVWRRAGRRDSDARVPSFGRPQLRAIRSTSSLNKGIPLVRGLRQILLACEGQFRAGDESCSQTASMPACATGELCAAGETLLRFSAPGGRQWFQGHEAAPFDRAAFSLPTAVYRGRSGRSSAGTSSSRPRTSSRSGR
jgi:hypothetical protein